MAGSLHRFGFVVSPVLLVAMGFSAPAWAQDRAEGLEEIIVTAQKREQSLQDVPIAITALGGEALQANRVVNVTDLSGLAPGLTTMAVPGGVKGAQFSMRGITGNGSVPGSDREVALYIDGVYFAASRGTIFDLPDIQRIEVLRGPQGTLFGRNATGGAISIITRDPTGELSVKATATVGNYDQYRFGLSVNLPQVGPFSGYVSYMHNERKGDIRNLASGVSWDRTSSKVRSAAKILRSSRTLGDENNDSWFAALKFESGDFTTVYKYDRMEGEGTAPGVGLVGYDPNAPLTGPLLKALITSQAHAVPIATNNRRPKAVSNGLSVLTPQRAEGHNVTSTWQVSDDISIRNIFAYRKSSIFGTGALDGISSLTFTPQGIAPLATLYGISALAGRGVNVQDPANAALVGATIQGIAQSLAPLVGQPFVGIVNQAHGRTKQISDEIQLNYNSDFLTATVGALWFNAKDYTGETMLHTNPSFKVIPGGVFANENIGQTFNEVTSLAAYTQLEFHLSQQLDVILGGRITRDKKVGEFTYGPNLTSLSTISSTFRKTQPTYLVGVNYKVNPDTLLYAKFSTGYVSGGSTGGIPYRTEKVKSWEAGAKTSLWNNRLQANLALYHVKYDDVQGATSPVIPGMSAYVAQLTGDPNRGSVVGTFVANNGDLKAKGFEFDFTAAPVEGVTLGGTLSYTDSKFQSVNPIILAANLGRYEPILLPDWQGSVWAQYETGPLGAGDARLSIRGDARWQNDMSLKANPGSPEFSTYAPGGGMVPAYWVLNGRVALKDLDLGGVNTELAVWGRNLTNNRSSNYALSLGMIVAGNYIPARTYGVDLTVKF